MVSWSKIDTGMDAHECLKRLLSDLTTDDRHPVWMVEQCGEGIVSGIKQAEEDCMRHAFFGRTEQAERAKAHIARLERDLRILACLRSILIERSAKKFAEGLGDFFRMKAKEDKKPAKK